MTEKYNSKEVCQEWPKEGELKKNMNKTLSDLKKLIRDKDGEVYSYVLTTVKMDSHGGFVQKGSAPNFQGGYITLCTCKHYMRTWRTPDAWKNVWIAGFTRINILSDDRNYLFYLMRVQEAFRSHKELWNWLSENAREAKSASRHKCGDVYEPLPTCTDPFDPNHYQKPIKKPEHVHLKNNLWHKDIDYKNLKTGRRPALLIGSPTYSFIWSQPRIYFKNKLSRIKKWNNIKDFIQLLMSK